MNSGQLDLIQKFLDTGQLSNGELQALEHPEVLRQLEAAATVGVRKNPQAKQIFKLLNLVRHVGRKKTGSG